MKRRREKQLRREEYGAHEEVEKTALHFKHEVGTTDMAALSRDGAELGYSDFGCSRSQHSRHSSSGSGSRSSSTHRKRSEWSIKCYTMSGKEVQKLNCYELITASIRWCLDIEDLTVKDLHAFLGHINFLSSHAHNDDFKDSTHVDYDKDIRKLAEVEGFAAFEAKYTGLSMFHYRTQNMCTPPKKTPLPALKASQKM